MIKPLLLAMLLLLGACAADVVAGDPGGTSVPTTRPGQSSAPPTTSPVTVSPTTAPPTTTVPPATAPPPGTLPPVTMPDVPPTFPPGGLVGDVGPVFVDSAEVLVAESWPVQVFLAVSGNLPTPCHQLTWQVDQGEGRLDVMLASLSDPSTNCIQVLEPFDLSIPLGSYSDGEWKVYLNGDEVGSFTP